MPKIQAISSLEDALAHVETLEVELHELRNQVNHQQRLASLGTIAAIIAHEFNNILTPMMAYAQMAVDAPSDAPLQHKAVRKALDSSERASRIAAAILNFAKEQNATSPFHVEHDAHSLSCCGAMIRATVQSALECLARDPMKDGIELMVDIPAGAAVAMEATALEQVILNLILNARKAMAERGGTLHIRARAHEGVPHGTDGATALGPSGHAVAWHLEIEDSGCGMSPEEVAGLFRPFATRTGAGGGIATKIGVGLGLVVSKRLVEAVKGKIRVRSKIGIGTCFTLVLPAA
ncbi:MAG: sensor histidine kinase [Phycisphaerales bacterium]